MVGLSVCLSVCWSRSSALQKRLNQPRCRLESWFSWVRWAQGTMYYMGVQIPEENGQFWGCTPHWKASSFSRGVRKICITDRDAVWWLTHMGLTKHGLYRGQGRTNPFTDTRGDKTAMRPFVKILDQLWRCIRKVLAVSWSGRYKSFPCHWTYNMIIAHRFLLIWTMWDASKLHNPLKYPVPYCRTKSISLPWIMSCPPTKN